MAQPKPTRKYEVSYQAKGRNKPVMTEMVEAHSESHVRCLIRASEGMVKFLEIKPCEECAA